MNAISRNCIAHKALNSKACSIFTLNKIITNKLIKQLLLICTFNLTTCLVLTTKRFVRKHTFNFKFYFNKICTYSTFIEIISIDYIILQNQSNSLEQRLSNWGRYINFDFSRGTLYVREYLYLTYLLLR